MPITKITRMLLITLSLLILGLLLAQPTTAQVPKTLNYQGYLEDNTVTPPAPVNKTVQMVFSIYDVSTGGTALWTETQTVNVQNGRYSARLGAITPITLTVAKQYYLGVTLDGEALKDSSGNEFRETLASTLLAMFVDGLALQGSNTFLGQGTGAANTTGNWNTFVGRSAGQANTTGTDNTFVGEGAGTRNTTGTGNTFIGEGAGYMNNSCYAHNKNIIDKKTKLCQETLLNLRRSADVEYAIT